MPKFRIGGIIQMCITKPYIVSIDHTRIRSSRYRLRCDTVTSIIRAVKIMKLMTADRTAIASKYVLFVSSQFNISKTPEMLRSVNVSFP